MKAKSTSNLLRSFWISGIASFVLVGCSGYQANSYYERDGIYGSSNPVGTSDYEVVAHEDSNSKYRQYYQSRLQEFENGEEIFTDVDSYNSFSNNGEENYASWGNNGSNITINVYEDPFYNPYRNLYYPSSFYWNSWYSPYYAHSWRWPSWYNSYYWGGAWGAGWWGGYETGFWPGYGWGWGWNRPWYQNSFYYGSWYSPNYQQQYRPTSTAYQSYNRGNSALGRYSNPVRETRNTSTRYTNTRNIGVENPSNRVRTQSTTTSTRATSTNNRSTTPSRVRIPANEANTIYRSNTTTRPSTQTRTNAIDGNRNFQSNPQQNRIQNNNSNYRPSESRPSNNYNRTSNSTPRSTYSTPSRSSSGTLNSGGGTRSNGGGRTRG